MSTIKDGPKTQPMGRMDAPLTHDATRMVEKALSFCESMTGVRGRGRLATALRLESPRVHDYFRHSLAQQVAGYLAQLDDSIVGVYTHSYGDAEEEGEDRSCGVATNINLILHVRRKTAALSSAIASLDRALLEQYRALVAPNGDKMSSLLDVQVVDDRDVEDGVGFGAVLRASYSKPVRLWAR